MLALCNRFGRQGEGIKTARLENESAEARMRFGGVVQPCASHSGQPRIGTSLIVSLRSGRLREVLSEGASAPFLFVLRYRHQNSEANPKIVLDNTLSACYNIHIKK